MDAAEQKPFRGAGMEGWIARWYTRTRGKDMESFRREAQSAAAGLRSGASVLEVAPGPGFFSIELAKLGDFHITGLEISKTFVEIEGEHARRAGVKVDFRRGNASAMPFADGSFDFVYCSAAFKNFTQPLEALNEMHRVLRRGGSAVVLDLAKDAKLSDIDEYVKKSGRSPFDAWLTKWAFRCLLLKRAYTKDQFIGMAQQSCFGACHVSSNSIGLKVQLTKQGHGAAAVA